MAKQLKVLLVDDEDVVRRTIGEFLRDLGHDVAELDEGSGVVDLIESGSFDLALIDTRMPGMDGMKVLERARESCSDTPIAIMTGHGDNKTEARASELGAHAYFYKPVRLLELDALIAKFANPTPT